MSPVGSNQTAHWSRLVAMLLVLILAACDTVPIYVPQLKRPGVKQPSMLAEITLNTVTLVGAVDGVPVELSDRVSEAVADALRRRDVPAVTDPAFRGSHALKANGRRDPAVLFTDWVLTGTDGAVIAEFSDIAVAGSGPMSADQIEVLASRVAASVAPHLRMPGAPEAPVARVAVLAIPEAPGDGSVVLPEALRRALGGAGVVVADPSESGVVRVVGAVRLMELSPAQQLVWLSWRVVDPNGVEIGVVDQRNPIASGQLDRNWGEVAYMAADGAKDGILDLLEKYRLAESAPSQK